MVNNSMNTINQQQDCLSHMKRNGIPFEGPLKTDGTLHRFSIDAQKNHRDEWYVCHSGCSKMGNEYLVCTYGTWSRGQEQYTYRSYDRNSSMIDSDLLKIKAKEAKRKRLVDQQLDLDKNRRKQQAQKTWEQSAEKATLPEHSTYLRRKQIKDYGIRYRVENNGAATIIIPLSNVEGKLQAIQCIHEDGTKRFYGVKKSHFHVIGTVEDDCKIFIAEGYATAASIHEATESPVVIAFDCGNLDAVVGEIKTRYSKHTIIICGDDDVETDGNPGRSKAESIASKYNCQTLFPKFPKDFILPNGKRPSDFNDLHISLGLEEVKKQLTQRPPYLVAIDIEALLSQDIPPRKLILSPWLPEKGLAMIYAARGIGKTFLSLSIAYAVACGESILGWQASTPRKVLYVDGEMPAIAMQDRLSLIAKSFSKRPPDPSYFKIITHEFQSDGIKDLSSNLGQQDINDIIINFDLVIIDNLSTLVRSGSENEAESWGPVQEWALLLRKMGKAILFIHHAGKTGTQRGTSKREDILDTVIALKKPKNHNPKEGAQFEVHFEKSRGFYGDDAESFEAKLITETTGELRWVRQKIESRDLELVAELFNEGLSNQRKLAKETGMSLGKVNKLIKDGKREGLIN